MGVVADALKRHLEAYAKSSDKIIETLQLENDLLKAQIKILEKGSQ